MYCPSCDQLGYPMGKLTSSCHCWLTRSKSSNFSESSVIAVMYLPSGDQRGENSCFAPGIGEIFEVATSTVTMPGPSDEAGDDPASFRVSTMNLPSGDQPGSNPASAPGINSRSPVPSLEIRYSCHPVF